MDKKVLYTGLYSEQINKYQNVIHCPLIEIIPRTFSEDVIHRLTNELPEYTHLIFTSKSAVEIFLKMIPTIQCIKDKYVISVGKATAYALQRKMVSVDVIAEDESSEGVISSLEAENLGNAHILWPHSSLSRRVIPEYLDSRKINYREWILYDTKSRKLESLPILCDINEVIFTSPSTIDAFIEIFGSLPSDKTLTCIGPVTKNHLASLQK